MQQNKYLTIGISTVLGFRLMSMLIIIPFFAIYALNLKFGNSFFTGLALGIFGLTQSVLQIPFGMLSDKFGYKKMMIVGLIILIIGLLLAGFAPNAYWLIIARAVQGSGAIVTVGYSWVSAVTTGEERDNSLTKLAAVIAAFTMISYIVGPLLHIVLNVRYMFVFSACLIFICLLWVLLGTKKVENRSEIVLNKKSTKTKSTFTWDTISRSLLLTVNNLLMMAFFFIAPLMLKGKLKTNEMWYIYTPAILIAIASLKLFSRIALLGHAKLILNTQFGALALGFYLIYLNNIYLIFIGTILIMMGSFTISAIVPTLLNKGFKDGERGKSNGLMVSLQYFGSFLGAAITGALWNHSSLAAFIFTIITSLVGLILLNRIKNIG